MKASSGTTQAARVPTDVSVLCPFVQAGVFDAGEVQLCAAFARLEPEVSDEVLMALAVAARGPRRGHACIELAEVSRLVVDRDDECADGLPWPELDRWVQAISGSNLVARPDHYQDQPLRPMVWDGRRLYLQRYFHDEMAVADDLRLRGQVTEPDPDPVALDAALDALFGADDPFRPDRQRLAARRALTQRVTVVAGGPGTGKTRTIARLLAVARRLAVSRGGVLEVALAAPTGKAAGRMVEALHLAIAEAEGEGVLDPEAAAGLRQTSATTLHRLLGAVPGSGFRRDARNPLPHDLVVVDETSMVSLPLMAHLLEAIRPDASLVLVGDPFQLASIEAGSVMSDVVGPFGGTVGQPDEGADDRRDPARYPLAGRITVLDRSHRFSEASAIAELAAAVRTGDADAALGILGDPRPGVAWIRDTDTVGVDGLCEQLVRSAIEVIEAAASGDARSGLDAMHRTKVLAATRRHPLGLYDWTARIERGVARALPSVATGGRWYGGRPVIVTANDDSNRLLNGDVGLVLHRHDSRSVVFDGSTELRYLSISQLDHVETWWGMTIHKSQGSEFPRVIVSLPAHASPILTRELLYTAVTRGKDQVVVVGSELSIRAAIAQPASRASGLGARLWPVGVLPPDAEGG